MDRPGNIEKWSINDYDSEEYFKDIPDLVNATNVEFAFDLTRATINGIH